MCKVRHGIVCWTTAAARRVHSRLAFVVTNRSLILVDLMNGFVDLLLQEVVEFEIGVR